MSRDISEEERLAMEIASSWGAGTKVEGGAPSHSMDGHSSTSVGGSKSDHKWRGKDDRLQQQVRRRRPLQMRVLVWRRLW